MTQGALFAGPAVTASADGSEPQRLEPADPFTAAVPSWLADHLERVNPPGRSAYAALIPCPRCGQPVLHGPNVQEGGVEDLTADPDCLDSAGELRVLLEGARLIEVQPGSRGYAPVLFGRDRWLIMRPSWVRGRFTVPGHRCGFAPGSRIPWSMLYTKVPNHNESEKRNDTPPF